MVNITNHKKEVSCKTLIPVFNAVKEKKIDLAKIIEGIPYDLNYLLNKHERIEWWVYCKIISNARKYFTPLEFEKMGKKYVKDGSYIEGVLGAFFLFSSNKLLRILEKHFFRMGENSFTCIKHITEYTNVNTLKVTAYIDDKHEFCPEIFLISKGVWEQFGEQVGHKEFKIDVTWIHQGVIFIVSWKREGILFKLKRWLHWLFNIRKAFLDLTDSHEELLNQYNKLEESKKILQQQTTQLKTAYEITKSIRRSSDIRETLNTIAEALVKDAGFSSAHIKLFKDFDDTEINLKVHSGAEDKIVSPIFLPLIINEMTIGEIVIYPQIGKDLEECNELLKYLTPIINITIHDSLVLNSVVDHRNNLELKVKERTNELEKAQQYKNNFFTNISHEFRTPLTLILGPVKQIAERIKDDKDKEELNIVHKNARKLLGLVNQLLDISKLESGSMKLRAVPQNVIPLLKGLVLSFASYAERKRITLKFTSAEDEIRAYVEKEKVEKVITNILSNALKFTPEGGKIEVAVKLTPSPSKGGDNSLSKVPSSGEPVPNLFREDLGVGKKGFVEITVRDTGIGIPKMELPKIFDRFYQVDGSHKREQEGTGIGLALTKELVELHKGTIRVESEDGKGTKFTVSIPLGKDHLKPDEIIRLIKAEHEITDSAIEEVYC